MEKEEQAKAASPLSSPTKSVCNHDDVLASESNINININNNNNNNINIIPNNNNHNMVDITDLITDCATKYLNVNGDGDGGGGGCDSEEQQAPFVCNMKSFNLHDAMAATQLMDRKMDCCEIPITHYCYQQQDDGAADDDNADADADNAAVVFPRPVPEGLDDVFSPLPWDNLTVTDTACIGIEILIVLQAFMSGSSVGESTFTCLYAHSPVLHDMENRLFRESSNKNNNNNNNNIEDTAIPQEERYPQLVVFTLAYVLVDVTQTIRGIIMNADIYEEEDFAPNTYDIPFYTDTAENTDTDNGAGVGAAGAAGAGVDNNNKALRLLEKALQMTMSITSSSSSSSSSRQQQQQQQLDGANIILLILGYLFGLVSICDVMGKISTEQLTSTVEGMKHIAQVAVKRLGQLEEALSSSPFLVVNESLRQRLHKQVCDPYINRPRVGNTPVRKPMLSKTPYDAISSLQRITNELDWALCDVMLKGSSLSRIVRMLDRVQRSQVNILPRSLLILNLYFEDKLLGQYDMEQLLVRHMKQQLNHTPVVEELLLQDEHCKSFFSRLAKPIYDTLKVCLLNRCRQRAYIESIMINDWVTLQQEAHLVDMHYIRTSNLDRGTAPPYFSQFVLSNLIRIMDQHLSVGLEMGLFYGPQNASMAYWYRDFLLSALLNNLITMRQKKGGGGGPGTNGGSSKNKRKGGSKKQGHHQSKKQLQQTIEDREDEFELALISVKRDICRGIKRFIAALRQAGIVTDRSYEFTCLERIFEERFVVFTVILQPPPLTYHDYTKGSDFTNVSHDDLLRTTSECFQNAKKAIDHMLKELSSSHSVDAAYAPAFGEEELRSLLKVCIGNSVYLHKLRSLGVGKLSSSTEAMVTFEFEPRAEFCTIKLTQ